MSIFDHYTRDELLQYLYTVSLRDIGFYRPVGSTLNFRIPLGAINSAAYTTSSSATDTLIAVPFCFPRGGAIDRLTAYVTTGIVGARVRLGIYTNKSDTDPYPLSLVVDSGELSPETSSAEITSTVSARLEPGRLYWSAIISNGTLATYRALAVGSLFPILGQDSSYTGTAHLNHWRHAQSYGALPSSFPDSARAATSGVSPCLFVRFSA